MNIYNAILKAAEHIERNPQLYNFHENVVPACGTRGCMIGWVGFFLGMEGKQVFHDVLPALGLTAERTVGAQIGATYGKYGDYQHEAHIAGQVLRDFAQRFKPEITSIPDSVRAIFSDLKAAPDSLADMAGAPSVGR